MEDHVLSTIIHMDNKLQTMIGLAGIISGVFLYLTPMTIFIRIVKERSSEKLSLTPYFMAYLNCTFCMGYAAWSSNWLSFVGSTLDACIVLVYMTIFLFLTPMNTVELKRMGALFVVLFVLLASTIAPFFMRGSLAVLFDGVLATAFSIAIYTSSLILVIITKEVEFMSFDTSILMFLNGAFWFAFGLLGNDLFMTLSNGFGCGVGAVQMYLMYPNNEGEIMSPEKTNQEETKNQEKKEEERRIDSSDCIVNIT